jgi:hypothetical protein
MTGEIERYVLPADPRLTGSLRLRFDLMAGNGAPQSLYSPDTLVVLGGTAPCRASDTVSCPAADGGGVDAGTDAVADAAPEIETQARKHASGGCSASQRGGTSMVALLSLALALCSLRRGRRLQQKRHAEQQRREPEA